jgi:hypothetical protein
MSMVHRAAILSYESPYALYRYYLTRIWDTAGRLQTWIMLNPSVADAAIDDATIRLCMARSRAAGFGGIVVVNLYAFRATAPVAMLAAPDPVGPDNEYYLKLAVRSGSDPLVAAWGTHGHDTPQAEAVIRLVTEDQRRPLYALRLSPCHPLRIPYSEQPKVWRAAA